MPTPNDWLQRAITETIDSMAEEAMAAASDQRHSYHACLGALNDLLGLALAQDDGLAFTMIDLGNQIQADLATAPSAWAARQHLEVLARHLDTWAEKAILAAALEQPR